MSSPRKPSPDFLREFAASMPRAYSSAHDANEMLEHAGVAQRRGGSPVNVEIVSAQSREPMPPGTTLLCVVADDRPGLLATISAAFVLAGIDVVDARAHTRKTSGGRAEAVDLFWVRHVREDQRSEPLAQTEVAEVKRTLVQLLEGKLDAARAKRPAEAPGKVSETIVRFLESAQGDLSTLEVETDDRSGLLLALSQALFEQRVQIVESEVRTVDRRVFDRFQIVELDGKPITSPRRLEIQVAVLSAIGPTAPAGGSRSAKSQGRFSGS